MHRLKADLTTGIIQVELTGFWAVADVGAFAVDLACAVATVIGAGRRHRMLYDYSGSTIQPQEVVAALQDLTRTIELPADRIALFTSGPFARMQAKRIAAMREGIRTFDNRATAMAWLREGLRPEDADIGQPMAHGRASPPAGTAHVP